MSKTPLGFRVDPDLKAALQEGARRDSRSLSSLVVKILDNSYSNNYQPHISLKS